MALEAPTNQAFLSSDQQTEDDFAALDSMAFTGTQPSNNNNNNVDPGFSGVSGSLFDRIRARTAEQQKQSMAASQQQQEAAQSSSQQQQQPSAFMSQQNQQQQQQQTSSEPTMEQFNNTSSFNAAAPTLTTTNNNTNQNNNNTHETTYSFTASTGGEDFSTQAPLHIPQYGASRDDPYYTASNNQDGQQQQQQYPTSIQDKASVALASTGETMKSLWGAGVSGAQVIGGMARDKMSGGNTNTNNNGNGMGERTYNNNFLLRDDSEHGGSGMMMDTATTMSNSSSSQLPPPPVSAAVASGDASETSSSGQQAYSMLKYGKTFCEDLFGFVMQLPPWGKGVVAVIVLWALYVVFG